MAVEIQLSEMKTEIFGVRIVGTAPLIVHAWDEKWGGKGDMRRKKVEGIKTKRREKVNPQEVADGSTYWLSDGRHGFPVTGIKKAIVSAGHRDLGVARTLIMRSVFIYADEGELVEVHFVSEKIREDMVRVGVNQADLRWRREYTDWHIDLKIEADWISPDAVIKLLQRAGYGIGIGDRRAEKDTASFGRFKPVSMPGGHLVE